MKKVKLLLIFSLLFNFADAQISFYGNPQFNYLSSENQRGLGIEIGIEKRINLKWSLGINVESGFTESRGISPSGEENAIPINNNDDSNPFVNFGPFYSGLYEFETNPDQTQISSFSILGKKHLNLKDRLSLEIYGGVGGSFVNLQKVEAILYPSYIETIFGEYKGEKPFVLPIFKYQTFFTPGLSLGFNLNRKISERIFLGLSVKNHWLPISGINLISSGVLINVKF